MGCKEVKARTSKPRQNDELEKTKAALDQSLDMLKRVMDSLRHDESCGGSSEACNCLRMDIATFLYDLDSREEKLDELDETPIGQ
jgi:hypothetical protein